jgi:hypothetical protein
MGGRNFLAAIVTYINILRPFLVIIVNDRTMMLTLEKNDIFNKIAHSSRAITSISGHYR